MGLLLGFVAAVGGGCHVGKVHYCHWVAVAAAAVVEVPLYCFVQATKQMIGSFATVRVDGRTDMRNRIMMR